jgi:hypothetical protein
VPSNCVSRQSGKKVSAFKDDSALEFVFPAILKPKPLWTGKQVRLFLILTNNSLLLMSRLNVGNCLKYIYVTSLFTGYNNHLESFNKRSYSMYCGAEGKNSKRISIL